MEPAKGRGYEVGTGLSATAWWVVSSQAERTLDFRPSTHSRWITPRWDISWAHTVRSYEQRRTGSQSESRCEGLLLASTDGREL